MKKVTGIGGIFFKSADPAALRAWYSKNLGIDAGEYGFNFVCTAEDAAGKGAVTVWTTFPATTKYFEPSTAPFMINYRVADLTALAAQLKTDGVKILDEMQSYPYGKFLHIMDPEGNKIELWEPGKE